METSKLEDWVDKTQYEHDEAGPTPACALAATLDTDAQFKVGDVLPPLWHWLYFLPKARRSEIGADGHPKRGGFLPPVPLPRRMWAGSRLEWHAEVRIGDRLDRTSTIEAVTHKSGRSGQLVFVRVRHDVSNQAGPALTEWQDIVYREVVPASASAPPPATERAPTDEAWSQRWHADSVLLFRFSALTFNSHRIHYDRPYAETEEHYPGLVVHGPMMAVMMMELARARQPMRKVDRFQFRGMSPVFDLNPFDVCGKPDLDGRHVQLFVRNHSGALAMQGDLEFAS